MTPFKLIAGVALALLLALPTVTNTFAQPLTDNGIPALMNRLRATLTSPGNQQPTEILSVALADADRVFAPVTPWWPLPDGWQPPDLKGLGGIPHVLGQPASALILPDLESLMAAADRDRVDISVLSAFRSSEDQSVIFDRNVLRILRAGEPMSREDAERRVATFSAPPNHSQHQLGTALDFTTWEVGYGLGARFGETKAGQWLHEHAWEYGFVFPYTAAAEPRSGYRPEPWHLRWVGRPLAAIMQSDSYQDQSFPIADDYVLSAYELVREINPRSTLTE